MDDRKLAPLILCSASRSEDNATEMKICEMKFVDGKMNYQIAMELNISTKTVDREISTAYKAINRVLSK